MATFLIDPVEHRAHAKPIPGFLGYWACPCGYIISERRKCPYVMVPQLDRDGYQKVGPKLASGMRRFIMVHRLMAMAFLPKPKRNQTVVMHLDDNRVNNKPENLKWATTQDNVDDSVSKERHAFGVRNGNAVLDHEKVRLVRRLRGKGLTYKEITESTGISRSQAARIFKGESWKWLEDTGPVSSKPPVGVLIMRARRLYYIQDRRSWGGDCVTFWRADGNGYTYNIEEAGKFTEKEVRQHTSRDTDVAIPCDMITKTTRVVMQHQLSNVPQFRTNDKEWPDDEDATTVVLQ